MFQFKKDIFCSPADDGGGNPGFTDIIAGGATENERDESDILSDQDLTSKINMTADDENMGAKSRSLDSLEDEPDEFIRGDVDVKEQMDRAADALDASLHGYQNQAYEDSPRGELGAAFKDTPGGLEEVEQKTDQALAEAKARAKHRHH